MEYMEIISVPVIATIVYWIINMLKALTKNNETFKRFIPILSGSLGAALGVLFYYTLPSTIAASNVLVAIMSGTASGLTATGCNQIFKQLNQDKRCASDAKDLTDKENVGDKDSKIATTDDGKKDKKA